MPRRSGHGKAERSLRTNIFQLLRVAGNVATGDGIELTASDMDAAARASKDIKNKLTSRGLTAVEDVAKLWLHPSQETANVLALFSLALRRSSPFAAGAGAPSTFADIRANINVHLETLTAEMVKWLHLGFDTIGRVVLRTDALDCYARLLSEVGEQLKAAAAAALPAQRHLAASAAPAGSAPPIHPPASAGAQSEGQGGQQQQGPGGSPRRRRSSCKAL